MRRYTILFLLLIPFITFTLAINLPMFVASAVTLYHISSKDISIKVVLKSLR